MGLGPGDLEEVPRHLTARDCYERIYRWHEKQGREKIRARIKGENGYFRGYLKLLDKLPPPNQASQADMDFVFGEVISGSMEWAYHEADEDGVKMAAYAHFALNAEYPKGFQDERFRESRRSSRLLGLSELGDVSTETARRVRKSAKQVEDLLRRE